MGQALGTAGSVGISTVLLVIMAILIIVADDRLRNISGYSGNSDLTSAHDKLVWAQVFAWIAAGLALLLVLGYIALHFLNTNEWLHLILWILVFAALITSGVLLALALGDIDRANVSDNNGSVGYTWGALILGGITLIILLISGGWRAVHNTTQKPEQQYYMPANTDPMPPLSNEPPQFPPQTQLQVTTSGAAVAPM